MDNDSYYTAKLKFQSSYQQDKKKAMRQTKKVCIYLSWGFILWDDHIAQVWFYEFLENNLWTPTIWNITQYYQVEMLDTRWQIRSFLHLTLNEKSQGSKGETIFWRKRGRALRTTKEGQDSWKDIATKSWQIKVGHICSTNLSSLGLGMGS
jgi:hypothetical protein